MSQILWLLCARLCECLVFRLRCKHTYTHTLSYILQIGIFNITFFFFCLCPWMEHEWNRKISLLCVALSHSVEMMLHMSSGLFGFFFVCYSDVGKNGNIRFSSIAFLCVNRTDLLKNPYVVQYYVYNYKTTATLLHSLHINSSFLNIPFIRKVYLFRNPLI